MKEIIRVVLVIILIKMSFTQWQSDMRLTYDTASSFTPYYNNHCLIADSNMIHVVWIDNRDGNYEIYYKRSSDAGISWGNDIRLTNNGAESYNPSIVASNSNVFVVWDDNRDGNDEIYFKRSTNWGMLWGQDIRLTNNSAYSSSPVISVLGPVLNVFWADGREVNGEIFYKRSVDLGQSWSSDMNLTNNVLEIGSGSPSISTSGQNIHIVWTANYYDNYDIFYKRSSDNGISWIPNQRLTNDLDESYEPDVDCSNQLVYCTWFDNRDGNFQVYFKKSSDAGNNWGPDIRMTNSYGESKNPSIFSSGSLVHIVYDDWQDGNFEIYYIKSTNSGISWQPYVRLINNAGDSYWAYISGFGPVLHIIWTDDRDGNSEIYYKRNPIGNIVSVEKSAFEIPSSYSLYQNYPNPFNPITNVRFEIPELSKGLHSERFVKLVIYDLLGREVATLVNEQFKPGTYEVEWDGSNYASGVYFYSLLTAEFTQTRKLILIK